MVSKLGMRKFLLFLLIAVLAIIPFAVQNDSLFVTATNEVLEEDLRENATIGEKMLAILDNPNLHGTVTGVSIMHADTGEILYSHNGDIRLHPASNQKLLSGIA